MSNHLYSTDETVLHVLEPDIESEMEELDDSDVETDEIVAPQRIEVETFQTEPEQEVSQNLTATESFETQNLSPENPLHSFLIIFFVGGL